MACRQSVIGLILLGLYLIPATFSSSTTTQTTTTPAQTTTTPAQTTTTPAQTTTTTPAPTTTQTTTTTTPAPTTTPTPTIPETTMDTTLSGSIKTQSTTTSQTNTLSKATSAKESTTTTTTTTRGPSPDSTTTTTTPVPSGEKGSSPPTTTVNTRTQGETVSTTPGSSQSAPTTTEHSDKSTGAPSTTASATTMEVTGTTSATAASPGVSATTKAATTVSSATTTEASTMPKIIINEFTFTGLFSSGNESFVELKKQGNVSDTFPENLTLVVMDGKTDLKCQGIKVVHSNWTSSLKVVKVDLEKKDDRKSIVVALYATDTWGSCSDYEHNTTADVMDVMVLGKSSKAVNISDVTERFQLPGTFNVLVVDESKLKLHKLKYSVSRCEQTAMNVGSFVVAMETLERENNCSMPENLNRTLYFNASTGVKCRSFTNQTFKDLLKNYIAKNVGDKCACGLSPQLISLTTHGCKWMKQSFNISAITEAQLQLINKYFNSTLKVNTCLTNDICLTSPCQNCGHLPQPSKEKGKINVTVAVVITCIVVFLVIVFVVIIYIRRKRRGILQFRMTRLNEDDDDLIGQDTDDFVGSQDASFSNSSYSRFQ